MAAGSQATLGTPGSGSLTVNGATNGGQPGTLDLNGDTTSIGPLLDGRTAAA